MVPCLGYQPPLNPLEPYRGEWVRAIEPPFVVFVNFFPHLNMQKPADYGLQQHSSKSVIFSYLIMNTIVRILLLL